LRHLERAPTRKVVHITSGMGSIGDNQRGGAYGYRMSKAALNMANKSMSVDLRDRGFTCVVMNPGWVQTDMGGGGAPTLVSESVSKMLGRIDAMGPADTGAFLDYKGGTYPY
jgi:NAD(P)-dependent dehydrogenase (short-subunit alcohol dehydrogenase family)